MGIKVFTTSEKKMLEQVIDALGEVLAEDDDQAIKGLLLAIQGTAMTADQDPRITEFFGELAAADPAKRDEALLAFMRKMRQMVDQGYAETEDES